MSPDPAAVGPPLAGLKLLQLSRGLIEALVVKDVPHIPQPTAVELLRGHGGAAWPPRRALRFRADPFGKRSRFRWIDAPSLTCCLRSAVRWLSLMGPGCVLLRGKLAFHADGVGVSVVAVCEVGLSRLWVAHHLPNLAARNDVLLLGGPGSSLIPTGCTLLS